MQFFVFAAIVAAVSAIPAVVNTGSSAVSRSEDGYGNYAFGYNEDHATGGTFRKEQGGPGYQSGSYGLRDADGRVRTVTYVADALGYRASVSTNEPGVDVKQDPAAVDLNLGGAYASPVLAAPVAAYAAPAIASYAAPVLATKAYAAPAIASYAAPVLAAKAYAAPVVYGSSYNTAINHVSAPVLAAPVAAYGAPLLAAKSGYGLGYNSYNKLY